MTTRDQLGGCIVESACELDAASPDSNGFLRAANMIEGIAGEGQGSSQAARIPECLGERFHLVHELDAPVQLSEHQKRIKELASDVVG